MEYPRATASGVWARRLTQGVESPRVGEEIGARTSPERLLIDQDKIRQEVRPTQTVTPSGGIGGLALLPQPIGIQRLLDQGALARTGNPTYPDEQPQGKPHREILQVIFTGASDRQRPVPVGWTPSL